jgi:hypothetical protein
LEFEPPGANVTVFSVCSRDGARELLLSLLLLLLLLLLTLIFILSFQQSNPKKNRKEKKKHQVLDCLLTLFLPPMVCIVSKVWKKEKKEKKEYLKSSQAAGHKRYLPSAEEMFFDRSPFPPFQLKKSHSGYPHVIKKSSCVAVSLSPCQRW